MKCFKCGIEEGTLIENRIHHKGEGFYPVQIIKHHISYAPEVVVDCCWSCHKKIHHMVRKKNACSLSVKEVARLSGLSSKERYRKNKEQRLQFATRIMTNVCLQECISYAKTGDFNYTSFFRATGGKGEKL